MPRPGTEIEAEIRDLKQRLYDLEKNLHRELPIEALPTGDLTVLIARVGDDPVAFLARDVLEVVPMPTLTQMPEAPPWFAGLLNLGGDVIPVVDVQARIEHRRRTQIPSDFTVLVRVEDKRYGLVVHGIEGIQVSNDSNLSSPPRDVPSAPYLLGVLKQPEQTTLLFSVQRLIALSEVPDPTP